MVEIDLDGKKVSVPEGSMVMHAADAAGVYIPHFCYHKKLSIAANCRMCLVDIEKAPKPMPACATPVTNGMVVRTKSDRAIKAQQGVMEFLLINHPLDCPICDQGGECQLQDLAVGYGGSASRYAEEKRVVFHKDVGPLISMEEMSRCIHCTRCVRFGQEIAGIMELGMIHRGEHSEITTVAGETVDSELSGNMIDLCPVGALTSKPFRYSARTWELSRRRSVSPHDSVGANLIVQVKNHKVMRVVPFENEAVNECWISDRDRFSYEALNGEDRLTEPMIKQGGLWKPVDWTTALDVVAGNLQRIKAEHGASAIGFLASTMSTVEELHLFTQLARGLGSGNVDHRLRHADFGNRVASAAGAAARWLGMPIAELSTLQRAFVVGSFLRKDQPLFAARLRHAARHGAQVHSLHAVADDWLMPMASTWVEPPSHWVAALAELAGAVAAEAGVTLPEGLRPARAAVPSPAATAVARSLVGGDRKAVLLGNAAAQHPQASALLELAGWIAEATGSRLGYLTEAANMVGAQLVGALPTGEQGRNAASMLDGSQRAFVLLNVEPARDHADPARFAQALRGADTVVALSAFRSAVSDEADVILPIAPFTETSGSFVNAEGRLQSFHGVVRPAGQARPAWKVLRVLANLLGLAGFDYETSEDVLRAALPAGADGISPHLSNAAVQGAAGRALSEPRVSGAERIADIPIHHADVVVRRAPALQRTADARPPALGVSRDLWQSLGMEAGDRVHVSQSGQERELPARLDVTLAANTVRLAAGHPATAGLGPMFGSVELQRVPARVPAEA